jgi:hypothetical protein
MSRVLKRPMFKMGGSTSAGITSGLSRRGYHEGGTDRPIRTRTTPEKILQGYGPAPRGYNVYDFLTEWGLNMASSPPMGNVIQTAAGTAKEPYSKMMEGKDRAGQLEYAMRAQAQDAYRAQNLAQDKMDLDEYLHDQKIKSAKEIAGMDDNSVNYYTRYNTNFDNLRNVPDGVLPYETYRSGMSHWATLIEYNKDIVLGPVIEETVGTDTIWKMKEDQDTLKKYVGEKVWDPLELPNGAFKIVIEENGIYEWSEPYHSNVGTGNDQRDLVLTKLDSILQERAENQNLINQGGKPKPDIVEKINKVEVWDENKKAVAVKNVLKILNDATFEELEKLASDRGYILIPPYHEGQGRGYLKNKREYIEQAKEDIQNRHPLESGNAISEYELIDMIKKEALHKQFGNKGRRKHQWRKQ